MSSLHSSRYRRLPKQVNISGITPVSLICCYASIKEAKAGDVVSVVDIATQLPLILPPGSRVVMFEGKTVHFGASNEEGKTTIQIGTNERPDVFVSETNAPFGVGVIWAPIDESNEMRAVQIGSKPERVQITVVGEVRDIVFQIMIGVIV